MNKLAILAAFLTLFFLFVGLTNAEVIISAPSEVIMLPNSTYFIKLTILNQDRIERAYLLNLASDLAIEPKQKTILLNAETAESVTITVKSGSKIGYYPLLMGMESENYSKQITIRVSQVPNQIKSLIEYYEGRLQVLKSLLNETSDEIKVSIFEMRTKLDDAKKSYADEDYDTAYTSLESIRISLEEIEGVLMNSNHTAEFMAKERDLLLKAKENKELWSNILKYGAYVAIIAIGLLIFYLSFGRKKFIVRKRKLNIEHLKGVKAHLKNKASQKIKKSPAELKDQIKNIEIALKKLSQKKGLRDLELELALVKEKYDKGMYKMCQEYLTSLKKKVGTSK